MGTNKISNNSIIGVNTYLYGMFIVFLIAVLKTTYSAVFEQQPSSLAVWGISSIILLCAMYIFNITTDSAYTKNNKTNENN